MIEQALRKHLKPTVDKQKRLYLALRLSICWLIAALLGGVLLFADWYWHFRSSAVTFGLCAATVTALGIACLRVATADLLVRVTGIGTLAICSSNAPTTGCASGRATPGLADQA